MEGNTMLVAVPFVVTFVFCVLLYIAHRKRVETHERIQVGSFWVDIVEEYASGRVQWVAGSVAGVICSGYCHESRYPLAAIEATRAELKRQKRQKRERAVDQLIDDFLISKNLEG